MFRLLSMTALTVAVTAALGAGQPPPPPPMQAPLNNPKLVSPPAPFAVAPAPWAVSVSGTYEKTAGEYLPGGVTVMIFEDKPNGAVVFSKSVGAANGTWTAASAVATLPVGRYVVRVYDANLPPASSLILVTNLTVQ